MSIIGVDHVQLAIPPGREARAREFYCGTLELPERPKPPELATSPMSRAGRTGCGSRTNISFVPAGPSRLGLGKGRSIDVLRIIHDSMDLGRPSAGGAMSRGGKGKRNRRRR